MKKLIILLFAITTLSVTAQTTGGGIIYGDNHVYALSAPKGWILDNKAAVSAGIHAVFYPVGENWVDAPTVMYTNFAGIDSTEQLQNFIDADIAAFKRNGDEVIKFKKAVTAKAGKFLVYYFEYTEDKIRAKEYIAYHRAPTGVVMLILHTKADKKALNKNYKKLLELTDSYLWISSQPVIEK